MLCYGTEVQQNARAVRQNKKVWSVVMKKMFVVWLCGMMIVLLACCSQNEPGSSDDPGVDSSTEPVVVTPNESEPVEIKPIVFSEEHKASIENYLRDCKYMSFMQNMENGIQGQAVYSTTRYSLSVNVEQNVHNISMRYITVDGINRDGVGYKMYCDGENIVVSEDGVWQEAGTEYETLAWDLTQFSNALDVFEYLLHDIELPIGKEGTASGEYWTIEFEEPADDSLLVGIEYDTLLDAKYKFTFREEDYAVLPDSVTVRVGYQIANETYYVESTLQFHSFGNTKISMPEVGTNS